MEAKLVRDRIPEIIERSGKTPKIRIAQDGEYWVQLKAKLLEEVKEYIESESLEELADIQEVLDCILEYQRISRDQVHTIQLNKRVERGGFGLRIVLEDIF